MSEDTLIEFPCDFPIKVMGHNNEHVRLAVKNIAETHALEGDKVQITERSSRNGTYLSFTLTLTCHSKPQLDQLYVQLGNIDGVSMVL